MNTIANTELSLPIIEGMFKEAIARCEQEKSRANS